MHCCAAQLYHLLIIFSSPSHHCCAAQLYHLLIQHAYLVLGPPASTLHWLSYYSVIAYQTADDVFSLVELEHCIIR